MKAGPMVKKIKSLLASILIFLINFALGYAFFIGICLGGLLLINRPDGIEYYVPPEEHLANASEGLMFILGYVMIWMFGNLPCIIAFKDRVVSRRRFIILLSIGFMLGFSLFIYQRLCCF